jgi:subtilisin family serine protease
MATGRTIRQCIVVRRKDLQIAPPTGDDANFRNLDSHKRLVVSVEKRLRELLGGFSEFTVAELPSLGWRLELTQKAPADPPPVEQFVISLTLPSTDAAQEFREAVADVNNRATGRGDPPPILGVGADLSLAETEYFCPANIDQLLFGDRDAAARLTRSGILRPQGLTGAGVNVVVIDEGVDAARIPNFGGGLVSGLAAPGTATRGHGLMVVRNILDAAPDATLYDVPLIPQRITDVPAFIGSALHVFNKMIQAIAFLRQFPPWAGPWILVNAWSIFDRSSEFPLGDYTEQPGHPLNVTIGSAANEGVDVVFAAGNCGQFCPDRRCGAHDVGPGHSIYGGNSHPNVLTTGAVRTDARWLGNSSQGPGQPLLSRWKPDLCAPSNFRDLRDAFDGNTNGPFVGTTTGSPYIANTGTSAACGLTAGIMAALRSRWDQTIVSPAQLIQILNANARKTEGPGWREHLGNGILDAEATFNALAAAHP